jgi:hypothetical protein
MFFYPMDHYHDYYCYYFVIICIVTITLLLLIIIITIISFLSPKGIPEAISNSAWFEDHLDFH